MQGNQASHLREGKFDIKAMKEENLRNLIEK